MWSFLAGIASALAAGLKLINGWRQDWRDKLNREVGATKQRDANKTENLRQGREAHDIDDAVARYSDDDLDSRLRKRARPKHD